MSDKVLLVTGASRGIGRAIALLAARDGWDVGVNYATGRAAAEAVVAEIEAAGGRAIAVAADVSDEAAVIAMFDEVSARLGPVTGFVANSGINLPKADLVDMTIERMARIFEVNLLGAYLCTREAARRMSRKRGGAGGAIVEISSLASQYGTPNEYVDYAGSKGGIDSMVIGLSKELGPSGIRINAVRPGLIETDIHVAAGDPDRIARVSASIPLGRAGTPEEVAEAVVWLLSEKASYVSGAFLNVGGGR